MQGFLYAYSKSPVPEIRSDEDGFFGMELGSGMLGTTISPDAFEYF